MLAHIFIHDFHWALFVFLSLFALGASGTALVLQLMYKPLAWFATVLIQSGFLILIGSRVAIVIHQGRQVIPGAFWYELGVLVMVVGIILRTAKFSKRENNADA